jgi:glycosyltransferase involved in cell wall biosynthesis
MLHSQGSSPTPDPAYLSLIVPAYEESARIERSLRTIGAFLAAQPYTAEIIVVDDGSSDATFEVVCDVVKGLDVPARVLRYDVNRGKGHALKVGFAAARGEHLVFADADLSTPIEHLPDLLERLEAGADVVIGSRKTKGSRIEVRQPRLREWMGRGFTLLVRILIADVSDATCGFKGFRAAAGQDLFSRLRMPDWSFDAELLLIARLRGYRVEEVPVVWVHQPGTKVRLAGDTIQSLLGLARIRLNAALGRYQSPGPVDLSALLSRTRTFGRQAEPRANAATKA